MPRSRVDIRLVPDRCDRCGRCERVCEPRALKVGPSYIFLDSRTCTQCMKCIEMCERGAIVRHSTTMATARSAPVKRKKQTGSGAAVPKTAGKASATTTAATDRDAAPVKRIPSPAPAASAVGPVSWSMLEALATLTVALATFLGKDALLGSSLVAAMPEDGRVLARVAVLLVFYAVQVGVLALFAHRRGSGLFAAFGLARVHASFRSWASSAGWVVLLLFATRIAAWVWGVIAQAIGIEPRTVDGGLTGLFGGGPAGLALSIALVVLIAPLVEEMLFRGVVLTAVGSRLGSGAALVISAALFGMYHFSLWMFVPTFLLGLACGYLAQHRGSLWPAVVLHALFNAVPVAIVFLASR